LTNPWRRYENYLLGILLLILAFNFVDRFALGLALQDIKTDLALSDTQLGLISGIAFAIFYSIMGIPIARWADRGNRRVIVSLTTLLWSVMVVLCGAVGNFAQLVLIRIGVGVGEAGCVPTANSLIADYFDRGQRARASAIYWSGASLGIIIGNLVAGWLDRFYGWRAMFALLGLPGVVLAALAFFTLREPRAFTPKPKNSLPQEFTGAIERHARPSGKDIVESLCRNATFRYLVLGQSVLYFHSYGVLLWQPTFFVRSFGLTSGELGTWLALVLGGTGILGTYFGGRLFSRYTREDERMQLRAATYVFVVVALIAPWTYIAPNRYAAFGLIAVTSLGSTSISGPFLAIIQSIVPERMRATAVAVTFLFANLIGMGLGPLVTGVLSDTLQASAGQQSLRYALLALTPSYFLVAWLLWRASHMVFGDLLAPSAVEGKAHAKS